MSRKVALIFPPATDPRSPHLSLPSLTAALRHAGIQVTQIDADLGGFLYVLSKENLGNAIERVKFFSDQTNDVGLKESISRLMDFSEFVLENTANSIACLRDPDLFYHPFSYLQARECIGRALEIISIAHYPVKYNIGPIGYDVAGYNASKLEDLLILTADKKFNIFYNYYMEVILPQLKKEKPDIVGISIVNYQQVIPGLALARMLKEEGHFVVLGGTVYSKFVQHLLRQPRFFNTFCNGMIPYEGETAMIELVEELHNGRDFTKVPNFIHLNSSGIPVMGRTHIEDVNKLQTPDFEGLPLGKYLSPEIVLPILTGKGCYFNLCKFCDIPFINKISRKAYRVRKAENVADDIHKLHKLYNARFFQVTDESMSPGLLTDLATTLEKYPDINARFVGYARLEAGFTPEVCKQIHKMGVRKLFFGLESGSQHTLDHMKKGINITTVPSVLNNCAEAGIGFHLFSIIGFPEETVTEATKTLNFFLDNKEILNHPVNSFDIHPFMLDLRTEYSSNAETYGIAIEEDPTIDFPISVENWTNIRGIREEEVSTLIDHFHGILREYYPEYRQFPVHLWPGYEEYSIQYADKYEKMNFEYRFNLPPSTSELQFSFTWVDSVRFSKQDNDHKYEITCLTGSTEISAVTLKLLLGKNDVDTVAGHLDYLFSELVVPQELQIHAESFLRKEIDQLLSIGAVYLQPLEN